MKSATHLIISQVYAAATLATISNPVENYVWIGIMVVASITHLALGLKD